MAFAADPYPPPGNSQASMSREGGRCRENLGREAWAERPPGADLGGSSKYSNENFEGRRGERFHVNGTCTWPAHPETAQPEVGSSGWKSTATPLVSGKGSRQNGSVNLGKGLALRAGHGVPVPTRRAVGGLLEASPAGRERSPPRRPGTDRNAPLGPSPGRTADSNWYGQGEPTA
ncbi:hypothetical protein H6P81_021316 [Aristolochia fimbriata]|uniref:Uncharacterized protein n=1 Tax=Aristolochia fimbriata TaxID=158543 RepID=A0AAV7DSU1_ARIFI|nr:hypothetical protein H6P81_021316 [Aristolochia fimbriata]